LDELYGIVYVILSSSGVKISFAMRVTFLGRGEGREESGGSTPEIEESRNSLASAMSFVAFMVLEYKRGIEIWDTSRV
jgi:hypothetical protein